MTAQRLAVILLLSVPPVLGHAGLATLDVAAAATILLALYALDRWLDTPSWRTAVLFGLASGFAVGTKFSAVPYIGMSLLALGATHWVLARRVPPEARAPTWRLRAPELALAVLAGLVPLLLAYGVASRDQGSAQRARGRRGTQRHGSSRVSARAGAHDRLVVLLPGRARGEVAAPLARGRQRRRRLARPRGLAERG